MEHENQKNIAILQTQMQDIKEDVAEVKAMLGDFIQKADEHYAPKWVADAMKFVIGAVILAVLGAIMTLVLNK